MPPDVTTTPCVCVDETHGVTLRRMVVGPAGNQLLAYPRRRFSGCTSVRPGDDPQKNLYSIRGLRIIAIVLTHAHFDHLMAASEVADATGAPVLAHPDDAPVWQHKFETSSGWAISTRHRHGRASVCRARPASHPSAVPQG